MAWGYHDISIRGFNYLKRLFKEEKGSNVSSIKSDVPAAKPVAFNCKFLKYTTLSHFRIYAIIKSGIGKIVPKFMLETVNVPIFTKGPLAIRTATQVTERVKMCGDRPTAAGKI